MANLQDLIHAKLAASGLSVSQAAKTCGISYPAFKKLVDGSMGQRAPQKRVINALAEWLDQNPGFLEMVAKGKATAPPPTFDQAPAALTTPTAAPARPEAPPKSEAEIAERRADPARAAAAPTLADGVLQVPLPELLAAARGEQALRLERDGTSYVLSGERALLDFAAGRI